MNDQSNSVSGTESIIVDAPRLAGAVVDMASLVEVYSQQIQAIARAAYLSLETTWGAEDIEALAHLLSVIENLAAHLTDGVAFGAAQVGITTRDDRAAAREAARAAKRDLVWGGARHGC